MPLYNVYLYREVRLCFYDIEADTAEAAAVLVRDKYTDDADDIEGCTGQEFSAEIVAAGDPADNHTVTLRFEPDELPNIPWHLLTPGRQFGRVFAGLLKACIEVRDTLAARQDPDEQDTHLIATVNAPIAQVEAIGHVDPPVTDLSQLLTERSSS
jgi:hypothetical protein